MSLSRKQLAAAHRIDQDVCVVAGPGSGKTSVLIERFSWLVTERGVSPQRILAITFTEKASTEIKQRMAKRFEHDGAMREQIERAYVSTVHAFCARLLRENAIAAAVDPQFEVLDWPLSHALLREAADEVLESIYKSTPDRMRRFLRSLAVATEREGFVPDLAQSLMDIYDAMRVASVEISSARLEAPACDLSRYREMLREILADSPRLNTPNQRDEHADIAEWAREFLALSGPPTREHFRLLNKKFNKGALVKNCVARNRLDEIRDLGCRIHECLLIQYYSAERDLIVESLQQIDRVYRNRKQDVSALDFDDLEEQAIKLLAENEPLRRRVRNQFDFILMDELQDTNPLQWRLLELIRRDNNFFAVGDVNQSIFGFRHAEPELFNRYRQKLQSEGKQVDELRDNYRSSTAILDAINTVFNGAPGIEPHELTSTGIPASAPIQTISAPNEQIEAQWVANRITELVREGHAKYRDVAILTRANIATAALQQALDEYNVPSIVLGGLTLFETRETRDLVLLLAVLVNPRNEIALAGVLRSPLFGVSDEGLFRMTLERPLSEAVEHNPPPGWDLISSLREIRNSIGPDRLLRRVIDATDYESGLSSRARANIEKFLAGLRTRYENNPASLAAVLRDVESAAPDSEAPPADFGDAVRLMTIHKAKGLEFPVVFLPFLHSGRGSGFPIISYSHAHGLGVKWRDPDTRQGASDAIHKANKDHIEAKQAAEDNRVLYVAMTRAKERMVLSFSDTKYSRGKWAELIKSKLQINLTVDQAPQIAPATAHASTLSTVILDRPAASGQHDATASVSDISVFTECPRQYYLSRYLGFPTQPRTTATLGGATEIGTQTHSLLANQPIDAEPEAQALAQVFHASVLGRQAAGATNKAHEWDFVFSLDDLVLRGQIDLWFEHRRDLVIVDYKTNRSIHTTQYEIQIQLYALALDRALNRAPTRAYLYFLRSNQPIEVDLSPLALNAAREAARDFTRAQRSLDFPLNIGPHCHRCDYFGNLCPARIEALTELVQIDCVENIR